MTITPLELYMILKLDALHGVFTLCGFFAVISAILFCIFVACEMEEHVNIFEKYTKIAWAWLLSTILFGVVCVAGHLVTPSTKQMAAILIAPKIINNESIQELPSNLLKLANEWVEEKITEKKKEPK